MTFTQPRAIDPRDALTPFDCGVEDLNQWLAERAPRAHRRGSARTYVVAGHDGLLAGYLALAATGIGRQRGAFHRDMPDLSPPFCSPVSRSPPAPKGAVSPERSSSTPGVPVEP